MKLIYIFGKEGRMRFVSHLDLQRFLQRALNRTCLPIAFSKGFNPHPIMSIAGALAMGYESDYEVFEVRIEGEIDAAAALETMRRALPADMPVKQVLFREDSFPAMMALVRMADYTIIPAKDYEALADASERFNAMQTCMGIRKTKSGEREVDVRKLCINLEAQNGALKARLMLTEQDTLKPDLLMVTLSGIAGIAVPDCRVRRNLLLGQDKDGGIKPITEITL